MKKQMRSLLVNIFVPLIMCMFLSICNDKGDACEDVGKECTPTDRTAYQYCCTECGDADARFQWVADEEGENCECKCQCGVKGKINPCSPPAADE